MNTGEKISTLQVVIEKSMINLVQVVSHFLFEARLFTRILYGRYKLTRYL